MRLDCFDIDSIQVGNGDNPTQHFELVFINARSGFEYVTGSQDFDVRCTICQVEMQLLLILILTNLYPAGLQGIDDA